MVANFVLIIITDIHGQSPIYSYVTKYPLGRIVLHVPYINITRIPDSLTLLVNSSSSPYIRRHTNHNKEKVVTNTMICPGGTLFSEVSVLELGFL